MDDSFEGKLSVRALQTLNVLYCRVFHQLEVVRPCTVPRHGPVIIICNHTSGIDPLLIQAICPRMIVWMMAREYYDLRGLRRGYEMIEAIPVDRTGKDMPATRAALRALEKGRVLGIFPEGKIEKTRDLLPFQPGVALLANKSQAPVVPVYLDGTQRNLSMAQAVGRAHRAVIAYGPPIVAPDAPPHSADAPRHKPAKRDVAQFAAAVSDLKHLVETRNSKVL